MVYSCVCTCTPCTRLEVYWGHGFTQYVAMITTTPYACAADCFSFLNFLFRLFVVLFKSVPTEAHSFNLRNLRKFGCQIGLASIAATMTDIVSVGGAGSEAEVHEFSTQTLEAQERHAKLMQQMEAQRRARTISVPTLDADVRAKLRNIGKPITLFGEKPEHRRDRLRKVLAEVRIFQPILMFCCQYKFGRGCASIYFVLPFMWCLRSYFVSFFPDRGWS